MRPAAYLGITPNKSDPQYKPYKFKTNTKQLQSVRELQYGRRLKTQKTKEQTKNQEKA